MANNRMYFVHRPTGMGIMLADRGSFGWNPIRYATNIDDEIEKLFEYVQVRIDDTQSQDDFSLVFENITGTSTGVQFKELQMLPNGLYLFQLEPYVLPPHPGF